MEKNKPEKSNRQKKREEIPGSEDTIPDWSKKCIVCGAKPILPVTGMCGPCTWGENETAGGNW